MVQRVVGGGKTIYNSFGGSRAVQQEAAQGASKGLLPGFDGDSFHNSFAQIQTPCLLGYFIIGKFIAKSRMGAMRKGLVAVKRKGFYDKKPLSLSVLLYGSRQKFCEQIYIVYGKSKR